MAVAFDATSSGVGASGASTTCTFSHTCTGSDRALAVGVSGADTANPTSVTYNGVGLTKIVDLVSPDNNNASIWASVGFQPASGANNVVVTFASTPFDILCGSMSVTGADQTNCVSNSNSAAGTSNSPSVTVTTASDEVLFAHIECNNNGTCSPGTNETELYDRADGGGGTALTAHGYRQLGSDGGVIAPTLSASGDWSICGISFKAVAGNVVSTLGAGVLGIGSAALSMLEAMSNDARIFIRQA